MKIFTVLKDPKAIKTLVGTAMLHEGASNVLPVPNDLDWIAPGDLYRGDVRDEATKKDPGITFIEVTSADGYTFFLAKERLPSSSEKSEKCVYLPLPWYWDQVGEYQRGRSKLLRSWNGDRAIFHTYKLLREGGHKVAAYHLIGVLMNTDRTWRGYDHDAWKE